MASARKTLITGSATFVVGLALWLIFTPSFAAAT
ncbi:DUF5708 family protein [Nonomuraea sp. CA-141351]